MGSLMDTVDQTLSEFKGELSYQDIIHMTWKEIGMLRESRRKRLAANPKAQQAEAQAAALTEMIGQ